ncbi:hypothetical protein BDZ88DRAFT_507479 [Geranomyces variabilis]|nr:hypothetical protein BDZ88DRAFT_507479 [Geranomyces variabilis]KAJ3133753.1 hypothetical protein HDU90_005591 [Geranomyces variabilis]
MESSSLGDTCSSDEESKDAAAKTFQDLEELRDQRARRQEWKREAQRVRSTLSAAPGAIMFVTKPGCRRPKALLLPQKAVFPARRKKMSGTRNLSGPYLSQAAEPESTEVQGFHQQSPQTGSTPKQKVQGFRDTLLNAVAAPDIQPYSSAAGPCESSSESLPEGLLQNQMEAAPPIKLSLSGQPAFSKNPGISPANAELLRQDLANFARFIAEQKALSLKREPGVVGCDAVDDIPFASRSGERAGRMLRSDAKDVDLPLTTASADCDVSSIMLTSLVASTNATVPGLADRFPTKPPNTERHSSPEPPLTALSLPRDDVTQYVTPLNLSNIDRERSNLTEDDDSSAVVIPRPEEELGSYCDDLPNMSESNPSPALPQNRTSVASTTADASSRRHNNIRAADCNSSVTAAPEPLTFDEGLSDPTAGDDSSMVPRPEEVLGDDLDDLPDMSEPNPLYSSPPGSPQYPTSVTSTSPATAAPNLLSFDIKAPNPIADDNNSAFMAPRPEEVLGDYFDDLPDMSEPNPLYSSPPASPQHCSSVTSIPTDASSHIQDDTSAAHTLSFPPPQCLQSGAENPHASLLDGLKDLCIEPAAEDTIPDHDTPAFSNLHNATLSKPFYTIPPPIPRPPLHHYTWYDASDNRWTPPVPSWAEIPKSRPRGRGRAERQAKARAAYHNAPGDGAARAAQEVAAAEAAVSQLRRDLKVLKNRRTKQLQLHSTAVCVQVQSASRSSQS